MHELIRITTNEQGSNVVDSRIIADGLNIEHRALMQTIVKYQTDIETEFGRVTFEMLPLETNGGLQNSKIANLTEDQAIYISTLSKNSTTVLRFKAVLVKAFQEARKQSQIFSLPTTYLEAMKQLTAELEVKEQLRLENAEIKQERDNVLVINELQEKQIEAQDNVIKLATPKVEFFDKTMQSDGLLAVKNIASELGMSAQTLNEKLKELNIQHKVNSVWTLKAKYAGDGLAKYKVTGHNDLNGKWVADTHLYWTQKGRHFINSLFNSNLNSQNNYSHIANISNNQLNLARN